MTATERVAKFKERQKALGRKQFHTWLTPEAIRELRKRAKGKASGEVIEEMLQQAPSAVFVPPRKLVLEVSTSESPLQAS